MGNCNKRQRYADNTAQPPTPLSKNKIRGKGKHCLEEDTFDNNNMWAKTIPFVPPVSGGMVIKVYDGDTITIASKINGLKDSPLYRFSVRLNGIDTPELKGGKNEDEKTLAIMARDFLSGKILHKQVELRDVKTEKYGRLLADVWFQGKSMNSLMVEKRFAVEYDGGTKLSPDNWMTFYNNK